ncbi:MAG: RrF2 family transcriptional regulator [Planctomycetota bacterium]|jgi:Rrf2 family protein
MKISSLEEYGLRCLVQLARFQQEQGDAARISVSELSRIEGLSVAYVSKLMQRLKTGGLVTSERGQSGGYQLSRDAGQVTAAEALGALSEPFYDATFCGDHAGNEDQCVHNTDCSIHGLWRAVQRAIDQVLSSLTLKDLLKNEHALVHDLKSLKEGSGRLPMALPRFAMASGCAQGSCDCEHA